MCEFDRGTDGAIMLAADHQLPGDPRQLVGQRHRRELGGFARDQGSQPSPDPFTSTPHMLMRAVAPTTSTLRSISSPARVVTPSLFLPAVEWFFGVSPSQAAKSRPDLKPRASGTLMASSVAPTGANRRYGG